MKAEDVENVVPMKCVYSFQVNQEDKNFQPFFTRLCGLPCVVSDKVPKGEVWLLSDVEGEEPIATIHDVDFDKGTMILHTKRPIQQFYGEYFVGDKS